MHFGIAVYGKYFLSPTLDFGLNEAAQFPTTWNNLIIWFSQTIKPIPWCATSSTSPSPNQCEGNEGIQCSLNLHELCLASLLSGTQVWRSLWACGQCSSELRAVSEANCFFLPAFSLCLNALQVITSQQMSALAGESGEPHFCQAISTFTKELVEKHGLEVLIYY